jgi:hypothetical protein
MPRYNETSQRMVVNQTHRPYHAEAIKIVEPMKKGAAEVACFRRSADA